MVRHPTCSLIYIVFLLLSLVSVFSITEDAPDLFRDPDYFVLLSCPSHNVLPLLGIRLCPFCDGDEVFGGSLAHQGAISRGGGPLSAV